MLVKASSNRHERRTALMAHKLSRLDTDIAALNEVRLADEGSFQDVGVGFTIFWSGKPSTDRRLSGVGIMVRNLIASKLETSHTCHTDRIISLRLPLKSNQRPTLFSVYGPTPLAYPAVKIAYIQICADI